MIVRLATEADIPALRELIQLSARELGVGYYSADQTEGALMGAFGVDSQLIADETYLVADDDGELAAAGGWSFRAAPFGGDAMGNAVSERLDPLLEPARIRALFFSPVIRASRVGAAVIGALRGSGDGRGISSVSTDGDFAGGSVLLVTGIPGVGSPELRSAQRCENWVRGDD